MLSLFGNTVNQLIRESVNQSISYSKTYYKTKSIVLEFLQISTHQQQNITEHLTPLPPRNIYNETPPATWEFLKLLYQKTQVTQDQENIQLYTTLKSKNRR